MGTFSHRQACTSSGNRYEWIDTAPSVEMPAWLIDKLKEQPVKEAASSDFWRQLVSNGVDDGQRNVSVTKLAGHLLRRYVDPHVVHDLLTVWNEARVRPPLPPDVVFAIVNSISRKEIERRKQ